MSWVSFYKNLMGINVIKWSWANYYKNAHVNKVSKYFLYIEMYIIFIKPQMKSLLYCHH
jgi:hypothetical protein